MVTDPPFSTSIYARPRKNSKPTSRAKYTVIQKIEGVGNVAEDIPRIAPEFNRLLKRWLLVFSDVDACHDWKAELTGAGLRFVRTGVWIKLQAMPQFSGDRPAQAFELVSIFHRRPPGRMRWNGGGHPALWSHTVAHTESKRGAQRKHPCPKPLALMLELLSQFTDPGDLILDPYAGSGTTGVAAKALARRAILIERRRDYCDIAIERLRQQPLPLLPPPAPLQLPLFS